MNTIKILAMLLLAFTIRVVSIDRVNRVTTVELTYDDESKETLVLSGNLYADECNEIVRIVKQVTSK